MAELEREVISEAHGAAGDITEPERLLCPITHIMYRDPCFVPESGNTYERAAVERYWTTTPRPRDPLTNVELKTRVLHPNWGVRREVQRFLEDHADYVPQGWPGRDVPLPAENAQRSGDRAGGLSASASLAALSRGRLLPLAVVAVALLAVLLPQLWSRSGSAGVARLASSSNATTLHPPRGSHLQAWEEADHLLVFVPPRGFDAELAGQLFFGLFWTGFTAVWTGGALQGGAPVMFAMFSLPFWGVGLSLLAGLAKAPFESELLDMSLTDYRLRKEWLGFVLSDTMSMITDLSGTPSRHCDGDRCELVFQDGLQELVFGASLRALEAKWVQEALREHLARSPEGKRFEALPPDRTTEVERVHHGQRRGPRAGGFQFGVMIR